ncbi:GTP-binding protein 10 [Perkinsus olseni]|uniref:GTP-binding protein 10 n=1 Tax=Perkinsus olseni TaxID=32597 RepID=A0A7J6PL14_PEROL|nr:GTP-binding protein 10 [Perkinsus olseni]
MAWSVPRPQTFSTPGYKRFMTTDGIAYYGNWEMLCSMLSSSVSGDIGMLMLARRASLMMPDRPGSRSSCTWDATSETLDLEVSPGQRVPNDASTVVRLDADIAAFRLPPRMSQNDERLTIEVVSGQMIFLERIKLSPMVVPRTFDVSKFVVRYDHRTPDTSHEEALRTFRMTVTLVPTVSIAEDSPIIIKLLDFRNIDRNTRSIYLTGRDAHMIEDATALELEFQIEESQGFILPRSLYKNDPRLTIRSVGNILEEPVKDSPLCVSIASITMRNRRIANRPWRMRVSRRLLSEGRNGLSVQRELDRCVCPSLYEEAADLTVSGFNLYDDDRVVVIREDDECTADVESRMSQAWSIPEAPTVDEAKTQLSFANVRATETGHFRICVVHFGEVFDVGRIVVRPSCEAPHVMVQGTCLKHCPSRTVPVAGECRAEESMAFPDSGLVAITPLEEEEQAVMVTIRMKYPAADSKRLYNLSADDPARDYFNYRFTYELADILDTDPTRFQMELISRGSTPMEADRVVVSVVLKPAPERVVQVHYDERERSPMGLYRLLQALLQDTNSLLYRNDFFDTVDAAGEGQLVPSQQCMSMGIIISGKGTINGMSVAQGEVVAIRAGAEISIVPEAGTEMEVFIGACGRNYSD